MPPNPNELFAITCPNQHKFTRTRHEIAHAEPITIMRGDGGQNYRVQCPTCGRYCIVTLPKAQP